MSEDVKSGQQNKTELAWHDVARQTIQNAQQAMQRESISITRYSVNRPQLACQYPPPPLPVPGISDFKEQGVKYDSGKPNFSMVSYELMEAVSLVRDFGAKKYKRDNWKKGFNVTRSCAAALRHIFLFLSGETNDKESGLSHLSHAVCNIEHALYDMKHHPQNDDRYKNEFK